MPSYTIFYSWQSDTDRNFNWKFIQECLEAATERLTKPETNPFVATIDFGMKRVPGSPEVATVMFNKIKQAAIFVADVTSVGSIRRRDGTTRPCANPNVLLETGFAAGTIGWNRIICIMNEHYGRKEDLPIDIRNRRYPICYTVSSSNIGDQKVKAELSNDISTAIFDVLYSDYNRANTAERQLDHYCIKTIANFKDGPYFHIPKVIERNPFGLSSEMAVAAIPRLIDIGFVECHFNSNTLEYSYNWTFLGHHFITKKWPSITWNITG